MMNGDDVLQEALDKLNINLAQLVAETAVWINPRVYHELRTENGLGVWYQNIRRYKQGVEKRGSVLDGIRLDGNNYANTAAKQALGLDEGIICNFEVCHIWDGSCYDVRHYTCVANLVLVPRAISCLTDHDQLTISSLRYRAYELYGWYPDHRPQPVRPAGYPSNWKEPEAVSPRLDAYLRRRLRRGLTAD